MNLGTKFAVKEKETYDKILAQKRQTVKPIMLKIILTHFEPCAGTGDFSDATLRRSLSVVTFDDDACDVPLVRRDETREVVVVGGIRRSGNLTKTFVKLLDNLTLLLLKVL
jgi:hypothetical protein